MMLEMDRMEQTINTDMNFNPENFPYPFSGASSYNGESRPPSDRLIN